MSATNWASVHSCRPQSSSCWVFASSVTPPRCGADYLAPSWHEADMSEPDPQGAPPEGEPVAAEPTADETAAEHGKHELPPHQPRPEIGELQPRGFLGMLRRGLTVFGTLAVLLCLLLGVAIVLQVRQTESGDSLDTARPADLLVLLDSLQQREAALNTEVADLQRTLATLQSSGSSDEVAIDNARARL